MKQINDHKRGVDFDLLTIPEIKEALDLAEEAAYSLAELEEYESYWKAVSSERTIREESFLKGNKKGIEQGFQQGFQQGIEQGIEQGKTQGEIEAKLNIARELKRKGLLLSVIAECTGLLETDIVNLH